MSDGATVKARVADPGIVRLLWALGAEWGTAMREATQFAVARAREQLVETATPLANARRGASKRTVGQRHGLSGRRSRLICRGGKLEERLKSDGAFA